MADAQEKSREAERCPMVDFVKLISGKWAIPILYRLIVIGRPVRFLELQRAVAPITQKELTRQLRLFEQRGLVRREAFLETPLRVEYEATDLGRSLRPTLDSLAAWMREHGDQLMAPAANPPAISSAGQAEERHSADRHGGA